MTTTKLIGNSNTAQTFRKSLIKNSGHEAHLERNNVTVKNCNVMNYFAGIYANNSSNNTITNNTASDNTYGIYILNNSNFNKILGNKISTNNKTGITISNCDIHGLWCLGGNSNNTIEGNEISNNKIGIFSKSSNSTINNNYVCGNTQLDFNSTNWLQSSGNNNYCNKANGWNDTATIGCTNTCKATDIFDAVEMLEYLNGQRNLTQLSHPSGYYKFVGNDDINLFDVFALMKKIVAEE